MLLDLWYKIPRLPSAIIRMLSGRTQREEVVAEVGELVPVVPPALVRHELVLQEVLQRLEAPAAAQGRDGPPGSGASARDRHGVESCDRPPSGLRLARCCPAVAQSQLLDSSALKVQNTRGASMKHTMYSGY